MREVVGERGRIFQWLMVPDVPSKAFLSFTQKAHCYSYHLLRGYCVFVCSPVWRPKVSAWCLLTSSSLFFETVSHWTCYLPLWLDWLASEPQESTHLCAAECWSYRCMSPCLPFMGDPQLWSQTHLCGKHFTHQSTPHPWTVRLSFLWEGKWIQNANAVLRNLGLDSISVSCSSQPWP